MPCFGRYVCWFIIIHTNKSVNVSFFPQFRCPNGNVKKFIRFYEKLQAGTSGARKKYK